MTGSKGMSSLAISLCVLLLGPACASFPLPFSRNESNTPRLAPAPTIDEEVQGAPSSIDETVPRELESDGFLELEDVLRSVDGSLPELLAAQQEIERAEGELMASRGGFDPLLRGKSQFDTQGFYESERLDFEIEQPTSLWGASLFSGYRVGRGDFAIYDGKAKTNDGGEARVGVRLPLLQGRAVDKRRAALWKARIERDRADPLVLAKRLELMEKAALTYWKWRAAGEKLRVVRELLELARSRQASLTASVAEGLLPEIILTDNERLVLEREALEIAAIRSFEQAAFALSLYWRDTAGQPLRAQLDRLAQGFPAATAPDVQEQTLPAAIQSALERRPEIQELQLELEAARLERTLHDNRRLPKLDVEVFASQDLGASASSTRDKDPFEFGVGVALEFPLFTRDARGRARIARAKVEQVSQQIRWARDRIEAQVRDSASALRRAYERIAKTERTVVLALRMEEAEREQLTGGNSDLLRVNLREDKRARTVSMWVQAQADYFAALASYRVSLALSPANPTVEAIYDGAAG